MRRFRFLYKDYLAFRIFLTETLRSRMAIISRRSANIVALISLYFVFRVTNFSVAGFTYSQSELFTYILFAHLLRSLVLTSSVNGLAGAITTGELSAELLRPYGPIRLRIMQELAEKFVQVVFAVAELTVFWTIVRPPLIINHNLIMICVFFCIVLMAICMNFLLQYSVSLLAFWTNETTGPIWLLKMFIDFFSGVYFPISLLPTLLANLAMFLPPYFMVFFPINYYLGKVNYSELILMVLLGVAWLIFLFFVRKNFWRRGLKIYSSMGG